MVEIRSLMKVVGLLYPIFGVFNHFSSLSRFASGGGTVEVNFIRCRPGPRIDRGSIYECDSSKGIERVDRDAASAS